MAKKLMKGSEAIGEAAVQAGCKLFFGYPITPQNEIPEYMSMRLPQIGGAFVQAESRGGGVEHDLRRRGHRRTGHDLFVLAGHVTDGRGHLLYRRGGAAGGDRQHHARGPGLGGILPSQGDYRQATKAMGHGDFRLLVLAPWSIQEAADLVQDAFDLADYYRNPVMVLGDGLIGQMMEPVEFHSGREPDQGARAQDLGGHRVRREPSHQRHQLSVPRPGGARAPQHQAQGQVRPDGGRRGPLCHQGHRRRLRCPDRRLRHGGPGLFHRHRGTRTRRHQGGHGPPDHPVPVPLQAVREAAEKAKAVLVVELSTGQMIEDVQLALARSRPSTSTTGWAACW